MEKSLKPFDIVALGFMTFAFFLGAGNMIFPPLAGFYAGDQLLPAVAGFLLTAVGLPLLGLMAIAKAAGGLPTLGKYLPQRASTLLGLVIYVILVPAFGIPRTALVAYEMGVLPFVESAGTMTLVLFSVFYFSKKKSRFDKVSINQCIFWRGIYLVIHRSSSSIVPIKSTNTI